MSKSGYRFDYNHHKKWLFFTAAASLFFTNVLAFVACSRNISATLTMITVYIHTLLLTEVQLMTYRVYIFLLVNVRIRFRQLNRCLR